MNNRPARRDSATALAAEVAAIWNAVPPIPAGVNVSDDFEARVQRAWNYIKTAYFAVDEHDRLRETLAGVIAAERSARAIGITRSSRVSG